MEHKWNALGFAAAVLVIIVVFIWLSLPKESAAPTSDDLSGLPTDWETYTGPDFTIAHPPTYTIDENYTYTALGEGREIEGIAFVVPSALTTGTNLSDDTKLSLEHAEGACDASRFVLDASSRILVDQGVSYSIATSLDAGAGNRYEEIVYVLSDTAPCLIVRYFIHSTVIENYEPGTVTAYDRAALILAFDQMRRSIVVTK